MAFDVPHPEQVMTSDELPSGSQAICCLCKDDVQQVAVMGFIEGETIPLGPHILMKDLDRVVLLVGPCGHSSIDSLSDCVYRVSFDG